MFFSRYPSGRVILSQTDLGRDQDVNDLIPPEVGDGFAFTENEENT